MIYYANKGGINPIKAKASRINNKVIIETEYKNSHLAEVALALWVDIHRKRKFKITVEVKNPKKKKKLLEAYRSIKKLKIRRIMGIPVREEENEKNNS